MDREMIKAFLDANDLKVVPKNIIEELINALESLKSSKEGAVFEAANVMNDACVELVRRFFGR